MRVQYHLPNMMRMGQYRFGGFMLPLGSKAWMRLDSQAHEDSDPFIAVFMKYLWC